MTVDEERIKRKIYFLKQNIKKLRQLSSLSTKEFLSDYRNYDTAKYNLQVSIEALVDIGNHIISRNQYRVPDSNADTFRVLYEEGIIPEKKINSYMAMARFRNMVVHLYEKIDESEIYNIINSNIGDFEYFINIVTDKFLD